MNLRRSLRQSLAVWLLACICACSAPQRAETLTPLQQGLAYRDRGELAQAEATLQPLADQGDPVALLALAETLMLRGRHGQAAILLKPKMMAEPKNAEIAVLLARAYDGAGQLDEAVSAYAHRLSLQPDDAESAVRLAELLMGRGDFVHAGEIALAALKTHPDIAMLRVMHGRALLGRGRVPLAREEMLKATQLAPTNAETWLRLGEVYAMEGEADKAENAFDRCLTLDPQHAECLRHLANLLIEKGDHIRAIAILKRAIGISPDNATLWNAMGAAKHHAKDFDGAMASLEQAQRLAPKATAIYRNLAEVALDNGQPQRALQEAKRGRDVLGVAQTDAAESREFDVLMLRCIVIAALADHLCRQTHDAVALQSDVDRAFAAHGLKATAEEQAAIGTVSANFVKIAAARCAGKGKP